MAVGDSAGRPVNVEIHISGSGKSRGGPVFDNPGFFTGDRWNFVKLLEKGAKQTAIDTWNKLFDSQAARDYALAEVQSKHPNASGNDRADLLGRYQGEYAGRKFGDALRAEWGEKFGNVESSIATIQRMYPGKLSDTVRNSLITIGAIVTVGGVGYTAFNTLPQRQGVQDLGAPSAYNAWLNTNREYLLSDQFRTWADTKRADPDTKALMERYFSQANGQTVPSAELWRSDAAAPAKKLRESLEADAAKFGQAGTVKLPYLTSQADFYSSSVYKQFIAQPQVKPFVKDSKLTDAFFASPERVAGLESAARLANLYVLLKRVQGGTALDTQLRTKVGDAVRTIEERRSTFGFAGQTDSANSITSEFLATNGFRANTVAAEVNNMNSANASLLGWVSGKAASVKNTLSDFSADASSKLNAFSAEIAKLQATAAGLSPNASQNNAQRLQTYDAQIKLLTQATGIAQNKLALIDAEISRVSGQGGAVPASMTSARQAAQSQIDSLLAQTQTAQSARTQLQQSQANQGRADSNATRSNQVSSTISALNGQITQLQQENARLTVSINDLVNRRSLLAGTIQSNRSRVERQFTDGVRSGSASISLNPEVLRNATGVETGLRVSQSDAARLYQLASAGAIAWASVDPFIDRQGGRKTVTFASDTDVASLGKLKTELEGLQTKFGENNSKITDLNRQIANVRNQVDQGGAIPRPTVPAQ
jgi:predicted  nucleic acid-binding Zn-ribbon protein